MKIDEDQIKSLLQRPSEGLQVELKSWLDPRKNNHIARLVKAIFAIRNRNGGFIVIGYSDTKRCPVQFNLDESVETLYHIDRIQGLVSRYANDSFEVAVSLLEHEGQQHPVIVVPEGVKVPVIVKRDLDGNQGYKLLQKGDVYFRTLESNGTPSSARVLPDDFGELLEICFENREADIGRFIRRHLTGIDNHFIEALLGARSTDPIQKHRERSLALIQEGNKHADVTAEKCNVTEELDNHVIEALLDVTNTDPIQEHRERSLALIREGNKYADVAAQKIGATAELQQVQEYLTMRVGLVLDPVKPDELPTRDFLNKVSASNPQYTGWPIWLDSRSFINEDHRPYVSHNAWQALIVLLDEGLLSRRFDFMRFHPRGEFYLQRVMQDDFNFKVAPGKAMDGVLMIYRVAEVLAVGLSIARNIGWDSDSTAYFAFRWTGLNGRMLSSWANPLWYDVTGGTSHSDEAEAFVRVPLEVSHSALAPHVAKVVGPLFVLFDGHELSQDLIEKCVQKMVKREMDKI